MLVLEKKSDWWKGRKTTGQEGIFPANYVQPAPHVQGPLSPFRMPLCRSRRMGHRGCRLRRNCTESAEPTSGRPCARACPRRCGLVGRGADEGRRSCRRLVSCQLHQIGKGMQRSQFLRPPRRARPRPKTWRLPRWLPDSSSRTPSTTTRLSGTTSSVLRRER